MVWENELRLISNCERSWAVTLKVSSISQWHKEGSFIVYSLGFIVWWLHNKNGIDGTNKIYVFVKTITCHPTIIITYRNIILMEASRSFQNYDVITFSINHKWYLSGLSLLTLSLWLWVSMINIKDDWNIYKLLHLVRIGLTMFMNFSEWSYFQKFSRSRHLKISRS